VRPLARLIGYLRRSWWLTAGAYVCVALSAAFNLVVPGLIGRAVDDGLAHNDLSVVARLSLAILVASALRGLFAFGQGYLGESSAQAVSYRLRQALYAHVQRLFAGSRCRLVSAWHQGSDSNGNGVVFQSSPRHERPVSQPVCGPGRHNPGCGAPDPYEKTGTQCCRRRMLGRLATAGAL
jgi:ABC-type multidrug transport system fused ATPase/permease subunit